MIECEWTRRQHFLSKFSWKLDGRRREYTCRLANSAFVTKTKFAKLMRLLAKGSCERASKACARRKIRLREGRRGTHGEETFSFYFSPSPSPFQMRPASFPARWGPRSRPRATTAGGSAARSAATSGWPAARAAAAALAAAATGTSTGPRRRTYPSPTSTPRRRATSRRSSARRPSSPAW